MLNNAKNRILDAVDNKEIDQFLVNVLETALKWLNAFIKEAKKKDFKEIKEYNKLLTETESFLEKETKYIKVKAMEKKHNGKVML
jgi:hypothetical protein